MFLFEQPWYDGRVGKNTVVVSISYLQMEELITNMHARTQIVFLIGLLQSSK